MHFGFSFRRCQNAPPKRHALAIEHALAADAHALQTLRIHQRHAPRLKVPFDARLPLRIVRDVGRAEQHRSLREPELEAFLQENRPAANRARRDLHHPAARALGGVNRLLDRHRVERRAIAHRAVRRDGHAVRLRGQHEQRRAKQQTDPPNRPT